MKLSKTLIFTFLALVGSVTIYFGYKPKVTDHVHYHAGFKVYIDGQLQDYRDYKYMNFEPCTEHNAKKSVAEEQIEKAHLHDGVGDVVHMHRTGAKWGDLFKNIGVDLPTNLPILNDLIEPNSSVIIVVGKTVDNPEKVSLEHIKEVETKSELCGVD